MRCSGDQESNSIFNRCILTPEENAVTGLGNRMAVRKRSVWRRTVTFMGKNIRHEFHELKRINDKTLSNDSETGG